MKVKFICLAAGIQGGVLVFDDGSYMSIWLDNDDLRFDHVVTDDQQAEATPAYWRDRMGWEDLIEL